MTNLLKNARILLLLLFCLPLVAIANRKQSVTRVAEPVTVGENVDYQITGLTPFAEEGQVNIVGTEHSVLIMTRIKPSVCIKEWLSQVLINGQKAVDGRNCQVKLYGRGCIVMPYAANIRPLTVYSEQKYEGESCNSFGTENSGGFMNTLTTAKLNNRIRSFKLKRGYMVTFSTRPLGRGYSRCFIAADKDLEVPTLPPVLDRKITSYRIFKWYDTGKAQLAAAGGDMASCSALNVTSTYTWGTTSSMSPDVENVPHHIYENYPSPSDLGACTTSPHMKTNNEPMNPADDPKGQTEDVDAVLANWESLMATGMRLCSPSSWDGSDYTDGSGYLKRFIDSIDARGWRCDIIDLHCYWPEGNFGTIGNWTASTGRPVWISEWVWGASWNSNGAFASGVSEAKNAEVLQRICPVMNDNDCIERYYYWNFERDPSKLYKNGSLTEAGKYYAGINSGLGYNGKHDFIPTTPPQYGPSQFTQKVHTSGKTRLSWHDSNGEYNQLMEVQMKDELGRWVVLDTIQQKEVAANYSYDIDSDDPDVLYRLHLIDLNGKEYFTSYDMSLGDGFEIDGQLYFAGGNLFANGDFDLGFTGWTNGADLPLGEPEFQVVGDGGFEGGPYLQSHRNGGANVAASLKTAVDLEQGQNYVFRIASRNSGNYVSLYLSTGGTSLSKNVGRATDDADWHVNTFTFNAETYAQAILSCRSLGAKAQIDGLQLRRLFPTREEAIRDGIEKARLRADAQRAFNTEYPDLNDDLAARMQALTGTGMEAMEEAEAALADHLSAVSKKAETPVLATTLKAIEQRPCPDYDSMLRWLNIMDEARTSEELIDAYDHLQALMQESLAFSRSRKQPANPSFAGEKSDGWVVKAGTFKEGDQRAATKYGKTCWNAWWSTTRQDATMEIHQTVTNLPEGYYRLECKAMTEHFCISDQHGYLRSGNTEVVTPVITRGYFDLPVDEHWDTLTTTPIYVAPKGSLVVGFVGSKKGAEAGKWHSFGNASATSDNREGWWCATDFVLLYHPIDDATGLDRLTPFTGGPLPDPLLKEREFRLSEAKKSHPLGGDLEEAGKWYDLSGRRVSGHRLSPGIYIQGGRKIAIE